MAKMHVEGTPLTAYPGGEYTVQFNGFKPKLSKKGDSINLNPILRVVGHPTLADKLVFYNCNDGFFPGIIDLVHAFGLELVDESDNAGDIPGDFLGYDPANLSTLAHTVYAGPLLGRTGRLELVEQQKVGRDGNPIPNETSNAVKRFFCQVPGCKVNHKDNLIK